MNNLNYVTVPKNVLLPFFKKFRQKILTFLLENVSWYQNDETKRFFQQKKVSTLDWILCSPDLTPVQNLWEMIVRDIHAKTINTSV